MNDLQEMADFKDFGNKEEKICGMYGELPKVDCRVWAEDSYQEILEILKEVRTKDIQTYVDGKSPLLP